MYPNRERAQLDHILINKKWQNSAMDCQSYNTMCSVQSDHRLCTAKIRLSLRTCQLLKTKKVSFDWSRLQTDTEVKSRYTVDVKNRPCRVMKTKTVLTRYTTTLSKPAERQPSCMYCINLRTRRSHSGKARKSWRRKAPYKKFSKAPVKKHVLMLQKLKMPRRKLTSKNGRNMLKTRYKKLNMLTSPTKQV